MSGKVFLPPLARLLMSSLFVWDGIVQVRDPVDTAKFFATVHVPAPDVAVWISIPTHLLGGLALLAGFYSRWPLPCWPSSAWAPPLACICRPETQTI